MAAKKRRKRKLVTKAKVKAKAKQVGLAILRSAKYVKKETQLKLLDRKMTKLEQWGEDEDPRYNHAEFQRLAKRYHEVASEK